ncbi:MAG: hypothetical protein GY754_37210 [bacterium]|nr:hypothetical protein [bacterium]
MKKITCFLFAAGIILLLSVGIGIGQNVDAYNYSGPYSYKNLTIFLVHGKNTIDGRKFMTLREAIKKNRALVHETGNVNQLEISNKSRNYNIFIMSGDIVKGGKQDRVIQYSYIIPPKTKKMKITSFCVESGRWQKRGSERLSAFSSSENQVASKELKMSIKKEKSQSNVWSNVAKMQDKLGSKVGSVKGRRSDTSLQLTLEHKKLKKAQKKYNRKLSGILRGQKNVIGYTFVINGEINSAEIFGSDILFKKLWPKLIRASITEAISEYNKKKHYKAKSAMDVKTFLVNAEKGRKQAKKNVSRRTNVLEKESSESLYYETRDNRGGGLINKSYLMK